MVTLPQPLLLRLIAAGLLVAEAAAARFLQKLQSAAGAGEGAGLVALLLLLDVQLGLLLLVLLPNPNCRNHSCWRRDGISARCLGSFTSIAFTTASAAGDTPAHLLTL
jgi:hypothetical protein